MEPTQFNRRAWDNIARSPQRWFTPAADAEIEAAKRGEFQIRLTATKPIPQAWYQPIRGKRVLALAAGGGHQGPILAAAGANVTVLDFSEGQLEIDRRMAETHHLSLKTLCADMSEMSAVQSDRFDLVINPTSVNFVADVRSVWREVARVLRPGGTLITGFIQPVNFLFDAVKRDRGKLKVRFTIPYSDLDLPEEERQRTLGPERPIDFGHPLSDLLGGQLRAGLTITDLIEDGWGGRDPLSDRIATFMATRSVKTTQSETRRTAAL